MKIRLLSFLVAVAVLCCCMTVTAAASETNDPYGLVNVLEYTFPNNSNSIVVTGTTATTTVFFDLPYSGSIKYVDLVVTSTASLTGANLVNGNTKTSLTVKAVSAYNYRIYGNVNVSNSSRLTFEIKTSASSTLTFLSVHFSPSGYTAYPSISKLVLEDVSKTQTSGDEWILLDYECGAFAEFWGKYGSDVVNDEWQKYDFMTFTLFIQATTFNSLTCTIGDKPVPYEISFVDSALPDDNVFYTDGRWGNADTYYQLCVTVDLTGVNRTSTDKLYVSHYGTAETAYVALVNSYGYISADMPDPEISWFRRVWLSLENGFQSVVNALKGDTGAADEFQDEVDNNKEDLDNIAGAFDSVDTPDDFDPSLSGVAKVNGLVFGSKLGYVIGSAYILPLFVAAMVLCFVSYALFGKKG